MTSLATLGGYGSSSDDSDHETEVPMDAEEQEKLQRPVFTPGQSSVLSRAVVAAPVVTLNASLDSRRHLDPSATEVKYNPR